MQIVLGACILLSAIASSDGFGLPHPIRAPVALRGALPCCGRAPGLRMAGEGPGGDPQGQQDPFKAPPGGRPPPMSAAQERMVKEILEKSKGSTKTKRVDFKSGAKTSVKVDDVGVGDNATLATYMTLPADQWITLDDNYIERLDDGTKGSSDVGYRFTVPLQKIMKVDLSATCDVFVKVDARKQQLRFEARGARLLTGNGTAEEGGEMQVMGPNGTLVAQKIPANFSKSIEQADLQMGFVTFVDWKEADGRSHRQGSFDVKADVKVSITFPPPLSFLPGFILKQAGGLVLKAASSAFLPRFGQLVAEDYRRWSRGEPRVGGSLVDNQEAMLNQTYQKGGGDVPVYFPPPQQGVGAGGKEDN